MLSKSLSFLFVVFLVLQGEETASRAVTDDDLTDMEKDLAGLLSQDTPKTTDEDLKPPEPVLPGKPEAPKRDGGLTDDENREKIKRLLEILTKDKSVSNDDGHPPGYKPMPVKPGFPEAPSRDSDGFFSNDGHAPGYKLVKLEQTDDTANSDSFLKDLILADEAYKRTAGFAKEGTVFNVPDTIPAPDKPAADVPVVQGPKRDETTSFNEKRAVIYSWIKHLHKRGDHIPDAVANILRKAIKRESH